MTEPELRDHFNELMSVVQVRLAHDAIGAMVVVFQDNGITQYAASIDPATATNALRELADRIERNQMVKR